MVACLYIRQKNPEKAVACLCEAPAPAFFFQIPGANPTALLGTNTSKIFKYLKVQNDLDRQSSTGPRTGRRPTLWARPVACGCRSVVSVVAQCEVLRIAARVAVQIKDRALAAEAAEGWPHFGDATGNFVFKFNIAIENGHL